MFSNFSSSPKLISCEVSSGDDLVHSTKKFKLKSTCVNLRTIDLRELMFPKKRVITKPDSFTRNLTRNSIKMKLCFSREGKESWSDSVVIVGRLCEDQMTKAHPVFINEKYYNWFFNFCKKSHRCNNIKRLQRCSQLIASRICLYKRIKKEFCSREMCTSYRLQLTYYVAGICFWHKIGLTSLLTRLTLR